MRPVPTAAPAAALALGLALGLAGCGSGEGSGSGEGAGSGAGAPRLSAGGGFVPQPVTGDMAAGYLTVRNDGDADDRLTAVSSDLSDGVTLHDTKDQRMRQVDDLDVPAGRGLALARGGAHLMLEKLGHRPDVGEKVTLTLRFAKSEPIKVRLPVQPTTYRPSED